VKLSPIRYARSGEVNVAYQVSGEENPIDIVWAPGTVSHLGLSMQQPARLQLAERLSRFARVIRFDKRGTGMSDRVTEAATIEERADDIRAVMDAAGSERAAVLGFSEGGSMSAVFAAMHPERVRSLVIWGCQARFTRAPDYPWGMTRELYDERLAALEREWPSRDYVRTWGAGLGPEAPEELVDNFLEMFQMAASPSSVIALERMNGDLDIRDVLPSIRVPTLIMAREGDPIVNADAVRDMAARIPGAEVRLFPGATHMPSAPYLGIDGETVYAAIEEFITGSPAAPVGERFLTTLAFFDLVGSTEHASRIGDAAWRDVLDQHYVAARRALARFDGREIDTAGDGLFATFDGPARAVRCARAFQRADRELGLRTRAGVHTGEVERAGASLRGINVVIASRIGATAVADEVLTSSTVRDLCAGSGIRFEDRGMHALKGVDGERQLFAAVE
jgi:pimeloyl-ACP methyl ester carboxylesterase/class 3 adenylate cyclase